MYFSKFIEENKNYTRIPENISLEKYENYKLSISNLLAAHSWEGEISFNNINHIFLNEVFSLVQISFNLNERGNSYLKKFIRQIFTIRYYDKKLLKAYFEYYLDAIDKFCALEIITNENFEFYINNENILVINIRFKTSEINTDVYK